MALNKSSSTLSRRGFMAGAAGCAAVLAAPAHALTGAQAEQLVRSAVDTINGIITSGKSQNAIISDLGRVFERYADVPTIALSTLGPAGRSASNAEKRAFIEAFKGYFTRKYGARFGEFVGGKITVNGSRQSKSFYEVSSTADLRQWDPFEVTWLVSDRSGQPRIFNIVIEGVNTLTTERTEIGAMLDRAGGSVSRLTADLARAG